MCGIGGVVGFAGQLEDLADCLRSALAHRGPDDAGIYFDKQAGLALVHTRLAILDLSPAGHQPMTTADGRFTIVFNGEIYNFQTLRSELAAEGVRFLGNSDTEVVLSLFARCGSAMLSKLAGMFAFAIWDNVERRLFVARDPLGIKPFYYWHADGTFAFASEVRALVATKLPSLHLDPNSLVRYLMMGSVQEPDTLIAGIHQLPAGYFGVFDGRNFRTEQYWLPTYDESITEREAALKSVRESLVESVTRHYVSDVPVGLFLSGGIDSTSVVALACAIGQKNLKTFCISFDDANYNEGNIAERTAKHFGTDHHDWRMTPSEGQSLIGDFLQAMDLPSNDGFNTYCVSLFAKKNGLKVVLSGLGGDEVFGGYPSFERIPKWVALHRRLGPMRKLTGFGLKCLSDLSCIDRSKANRVTAYLGSNGGYSSAYWMERAFFTPAEATRIVRELTGKTVENQDCGLFVDPKNLPSDGNKVGYLECTRYMRNQLLRDSDVMSMVHGLELRTPLVDQRFFDSVGRVHSSLRFRKNKQMLLDAVPEVPEWVWNRPKQGFRFPFEEWVNRHWKDRFVSVEKSITVPLGKWYRKWTVLSLLNFTTKLGLA